MCTCLSIRAEQAFQLCLYCLVILSCSAIQEDVRVTSYGHVMPHSQAIVSNLGML